MHTEHTLPAFARLSRRTIGGDDFRFVLVGALVLLVLVALGDAVWFLAPLRLLLGVTYILYVPGYCFTAALFPAADDLDGIEHLGLSIGLSVAMIPLLALLLDVLPWGLRMWPILVCEYGFIAVCAAVALGRRANHRPGSAYVPVLRWRPRAWWREMPLLERRVYGLIAAVLSGAMLCLAWVFLVPSPDTYMTEFYMLGPAGHAEDYPRDAAVGDSLSVTLGLVNRERAQQTYRVEVWVADTWNPDKRMLVARYGPLTLIPGQKHDWPFAWKMPWAGNDQRVEFKLFNDDSQQPYRQMQFSLDIKQ